MIYPVKHNVEVTRKPENAVERTLVELIFCKILHSPPVVSEQRTTTLTRPQNLRDHNKTAIRSKTSRVIPVDFSRGGTMIPHVLLRTEGLTAACTRALRLFPLALPSKMRILPQVRQKYHARGERRRQTKPDNNEFSDKTKERRFTLLEMQDLGTSHMTRSLLHVQLKSFLDPPGLTKMVSSFFRGACSRGNGAGRFHACRGAR